MKCEWSNQDDYEEGMHIPDEKATMILIGEFYRQLDRIEKGKQEQLIKRDTQ